jgi:hypothetical protein
VAKLRSQRNELPLLSYGTIPITCAVYWIASELPVMVWRNSLALISVLSCCYHDRIPSRKGQWRKTEFGVWKIGHSLVNS